MGNRIDRPHGRQGGRSAGRQSSGNRVTSILGESVRELGGKRLVTSSIITVATMKGGSGKSTVAACLAVHWHLAGRRPTIIDADPQRSIARLVTRERALGGVPVVEDTTECA
jgi:Mrp family chromosome partitioning ATPase